MYNTKVSKWFYIMYTQLFFTQLFLCIYRMAQTKSSIIVFDWPMETISLYSTAKTKYEIYFSQNNFILSTNLFQFHLLHNRRGFCRLHIVKIIINYISYLNLKIFSKLISPRTTILCILLFYHVIVFRR